MLLVKKSTGKLRDEQRNEAKTVDGVKSKVISVAAQFLELMSFVLERLISSTLCALHFRRDHEFKTGILRLNHSNFARIVHHFPRNRQCRIFGSSIYGCS